MTKYLAEISGYTLETFEHGVILKLYLHKIKHRNLLVTVPEAQTTPLNLSLCSLFYYFFWNHCLGYQKFFTL